MTCILYAHNGSGNHGCEALVRSTAGLLPGKPALLTTAPAEDYRFALDHITDISEDADADLPRNSPAYLRAALQTKLTGSTVLFTKYRRKALLSQVHSGDLCLSIGGDNYCYAGTEILADLNQLMQKQGAKTVLWGCSIDPEALTPAMARDLNRYDLITVREPLTQQALARAGVSKNVRKVADPAFLLQPAEIPLPEGFRPGSTIGLNMSPLVLKYTQDGKNALDSFYALVDHILSTTDSTIALIPHVVKENNSDLSVLEPVFQKYQSTGRVILIPDQNCMQLKYIISRCRLFIGARTHATIAAYSTCVPTLVIGYSVKSRGIATDLFGTDQNYVLPVQEIRQPEDLIRAYQWLEAHAGDMKRRLTEIIPAYQEQARLGAAYLNELTAL